MPKASYYGKGYKKRSGNDQYVSGERISYFGKPKGWETDKAGNLVKFKNKPVPQKLPKLKRKAK